MKKLTNLEIKARLTDSKLKATYQRIVIYEALLRLGHPTAESIYEYIRGKYPSISLATVYKTLETFGKAGLVIKVQSNGEKHRYDANMESHNHLYCKKTGRIIDYKDEELEQLIHDHLKKKKLDKNFKINNIHLQITGETSYPTENS